MLSALMGRVCPGSPWLPDLDNTLHHIPSVLYPEGTVQPRGCAEQATPRLVSRHCAQTPTGTGSPRAPGYWQGPG